MRANLPAFFCLAMHGLLVACSQQQETVPAASSADTVRALLTEHSDLRDPFSLQFRYLIYERTAPGVEEWCGQLNATSGMGGYHGWNPFWLMRRDTSVTFELAADSVNDPANRIILFSCRTMAPRAVAVLQTLDSLQRVADSLDALRDSVEAIQARKAEIALKAFFRRVEDSIQRAFCSRLPRTTSREEQAGACHRLAERNYEQAKHCLISCYQWPRDSADVYWRVAPFVIVR